MRKLIDESKEAMDHPLRQSAKILKCAGLPKGEGALLTTKFCEMKRACNAAVSGSVNLLREMMALEERLLMLRDELDSLNLCESTNCDVKVVSCKVGVGPGDATNLVTGVRRSTVSLHNSVCYNFDGALVGVSKHLS